MPPRKNAAAAATDATTKRPSTRSSTRSKAPTSSSKPAPQSASKAESKSKRVRADSDDETDKPVSKKVKGDEDTQDEVPKMVTVIKRGAAPVDPVSGYVDTHQVYSSGDEVWDAMLNQTDVGKNANKFYVIQLLHTIGSNSSCMLFTRWGRVGEDGQTQFKGPFSAATAVNEFKKQFRSKTGTAWESRKGMTAKKGRYTWLERAFEDEDESDDKKVQAGPSKQSEPDVVPDSALIPEIQALCKLIFSISLFEAHLSSMNYDANKLPLGKLAKSTILNGFAALKVLSEVIADPTGNTATSLGGFAQACQELTGRYYSIVPHVFGRNTRPLTISTMPLLKKELELVDALGDMEIAQELIQTSTLLDAKGNAINPVDAHFRSLKLSFMELVDPSSREFQALAAYATDSHGTTHSHFRVKIQNAYRVERQEETHAWTQDGFENLLDGQRMLLWHGSRTTNFAGKNDTFSSKFSQGMKRFRYPFSSGILRQGLRIAPPEAPATGYMFGKGVYFADMVSKSANYCHAYLSDGVGLLLLCEVAAKPFFEQADANFNADQDCKVASKLATKGLGTWQPTKWQDAGKALGNNALNGCVMPDGLPADSGLGTGLLYNEYIVYSASQIRLRYLLMFKMENY
ncbi:hypothetical protein EW146_g480 [Bondarzewia mesenterica]|uniref:Poly [ADP-ribose] polymerase n=1 Tax=Bondarzewia mesenterica TaxID=1095465 RepID=A0A4S4M958_9AGAM|nr:hypothetical protein EW146_g480 [Bondarzewia mesenterica]